MLPECPIEYDRSKTNGISGYPLGVEVAIIAGLQVTTIVGLGDSAIKDAKDRMETCTEALGYAYPSRTVVINLRASAAMFQEEPRFVIV